MSPAATSAASTGAAATGAAVQEAAPPAKRCKPAVCASRADAQYAVVSKRRDRCLSGSSPLESPEKVRGIEEIIDNFRIALGDDELQREEMEEKEMEKEKEKGREEKESCLSGFRSHPFPISKGLLVLAACQPMMIQHILSVFVVVSKFHERNI
jgi:hypothetical protein